MSENLTENRTEEVPEKSPPPPGTLAQDDVVVQQNDARASAVVGVKPKTSDCDIPAKKRRTRRGKSKRRYPYMKNGRKSAKMIQPKAPYNSNQFLLEDHGNIEELDENLKHADELSTRTRDSSFSVDSESEFYSSPDDEEQFLIKDFDDQYESVQAERLQLMSKDELIQEYLILERKVELLTKILRKKGTASDCCDGLETTSTAPELQNEVERLTIEVEALKRENAMLKSKTCSSGSEDSETDSDDSCSSSSSSSSSNSCCSKPSSPIVDYSQTNGHSSASVETA